MQVEQIVIDSTGKEVIEIKAEAINRIETLSRSIREINKESIGQLAIEKISTTGGDND